MKTEQLNGFEIILCIIILLLIMLVVPINREYGFDKGYKKGQVDALNGKIMFKKVIIKDNLENWKKINEK